MATMIEFSKRGTILAEIRRPDRRPDQRSRALVSVGLAFSAPVVAVQMALIAAGYDVGSFGADGKLGPKTIAAIKKYQTDHGMAPTGSIEDATKDIVGGAAGGITAAVVSTPAGKAATTAIAKEVAASVAKDVAKDMTLPLVLGGVVVLLVGVTIWALTKKGV
jgi:peptidoglycan hydrolase-like protein with peptidoglycan-binding domain